MTAVPRGCVPLCTALLAALAYAQPADLILVNGAVYTMERDLPAATVVAIRGNRIAGVFRNRTEAAKLIGPRTAVRDLRGAMVLPGFVDGHTHFDRAGALLNDANLLRVSSDEALRTRIAKRAMESIVSEGYTWRDNARRVVHRAEAILKDRRGAA